jgi:thioredoxin 1
MKKILMFTMACCPYCVMAHRWMRELLEERPEYRDIEIKIVDELLHPKYADKFDYYYVPTYYVGGEKVHEGVPTKEIIEKVYREAYLPTRP